MIRRCTVVSMTEQNVPRRPSRQRQILARPHPLLVQQSQGQPEPTDTPIRWRSESRRSNARVAAQQKRAVEMLYLLSFHTVSSILLSCSYKIITTVTSKHLQQRAARQRDRRAEGQRGRETEGQTGRAIKHGKKRQKGRRVEQTNMAKETEGQTGRANKRWPVRGMAGTEHNTASPNGWKLHSASLVHQLATHTRARRAVAPL